MNLSIIFVNWNTRDLLGQALRSIPGDRFNAPDEVWVVDNASTDGSQEMLRDEFPQVHWIGNATNLGFASANNQAMRQAGGEYLLLLNSDTIVRPGAIEKMLEVVRTHPELGILGGRLVNADGSTQASWAEFPSLSSELLGRNFRKRKPVDSTPGLFEVDWVGGACLLARKAAVEKVGLLDESFFMYSEEVDWCYRMRRAGWKTGYLESAEIVHLGGGSASRSDAEQLIRLYQSKLRFFEKHYGRRKANQLRRGLIWIQRLGIFRRRLAAWLHLRDKAILCQRMEAQLKLVNWLESYQAFARTPNQMIGADPSRPGG